jgi:hypothetical protein
VISAIERNRERIWVKLLYDSVSGSVAKFDRQINENSLLAELKRKAENIISKKSLFFLAKKPIHRMVNGFLLRDDYAV